MSMGKKFIKVSDVETANLLTKLGFQLIDKTSGIYTFLIIQQQNFQTT